MSKNKYLLTSCTHFFYKRAIGALYCQDFKLKNIFLFTGFLVFTTLPMSAKAQGSNSLKLLVNPFVYRLGNIDNQYTSLDNEYISASYFNKPAQEFGLGYSYTKSKFSLNTGFSWFHRKHRVNLIFQNPDPSFSDMILNFHDIQLEENLLGIRVGGEYALSDQLSVGLNILLYAPLEIRSNMANYKIHYLRYGYNNVITPDTSYSELSFQMENKIRRAPRNGLIIPELYLTYELYKNLNLLVGCKFKFWTSKDDWLLKIDSKGFTNASESNNVEPLFDSRIKNQGFYSFIGLTYDLPLTRKSNR